MAFKKTEVSKTPATISQFSIEQKGVEKQTKQLVVQQPIKFGLDKVCRYWKRDEN